MKKKIIKENCRFDIDFVEFAILTESCIPETPIARAYFWGNVIDKYYYVLTDDERLRLFEWINKNWKFIDSLEKGNEDCLLFNARYNPENQFLIKTLYDNKEEIIECFKFNDKYYTEKNRYVSEEFIKRSVKPTHRFYVGGI